METMAKLREVGERKLVDSIGGIVRPGSRDCVVGLGDDAAVLKTRGGIAVSTDVVTRDRHFPAGMTFERFGWTAAAVSFSDIASMGARPIGLTAAVTIEGESDEKDLYDIISGIDQCCEFCETDYIGGDTKEGSLSVATTALGSLDGRAPMTRSGASPGDLVAVTGLLGMPAAGFYAAEAGIDAEEQILALNLPLPRVMEGMEISKSGAATSCMDLSDGLADAARKICAASGVGMDIEWDFLPVGPGVGEICEIAGKDLRHTVTCWGGEYELLFTFDRSKVQALYDRKVPFSIIGTVFEGEGAYMIDDDGREAFGDAVY